MPNRVRRWLARRAANRPSYNGPKGPWLVWRSTGILGDYRFPVTIRIIQLEKLQLTDEDIAVIIKRYKDHLLHWNICVEVIQRELNEFSKAVGKPYLDIANLFDRTPPVATLGDAIPGPKGEKLLGAEENV